MDAYGKTVAVIEEMRPERTSAARNLKEKYLAKFRKFCIRSQISFLKKSSKNSQKIQGYRSWRADSKNIACLWSRSNIFFECIYYPLLLKNTLFLFHKIKVYFLKFLFNSVWSCYSIPFQLFGKLADPNKSLIWTHLFPN